MRGKNRHTQAKCHVTTGRDGSDAAASQGLPAATQRGRGKAGFSLEPSGAVALPTP